MKGSGTLLFSIIIALALVMGYGYYSYSGEIKKLSLDLNAMTQARESVEKRLKESEDTNAYILQKFTEEQNRNNEFATQIQGILSTVGTLDKLSKTDKELLQKYSKVYFLNEHYIPESLSSIPAAEINEKGKQIEIHSKVLPFLEKMIAAATSAGNPISIISGYRDFGTQSSLKSTYKVTYGAGSANQFSADQGYSEHQLGTALDFTTPALGSMYESFEREKAYTWLQNNAYQYGFVLSYPRGNDYYEFEPWHWRFVGVKLATMLHNEGQNFYDVDQREIDNYLINIFD